MDTTLLEKWPHSCCNPETTYAVLAGSYVKIGSTNCLSQRLTTLQTGNPEELILLGISSIPEKQAHLELARHRHRREWFIFNDYVRHYIWWNFRLTTDSRIPSIFPPEKFMSAL
jgi:hypothetical protein